MPYFCCSVTDFWMTCVSGASGHEYTDISYPAANIFVHISSLFDFYQATQRVLVLTNDRVNKAPYFCCNCFLDDVHDLDLGFRTRIRKYFGCVSGSPIFLSMWKFLHIELDVCPAITAYLAEEMYWYTTALWILSEYMFTCRALKCRSLWKL